ncbi:MAG: helix-turn-helix domain-containing protein [Planctomycetota bacterium]
MATTKKKAKTKPRARRAAIKTAMGLGKKSQHKNPGLELRVFREKLGITREVMARLVGMSLSKVAKLEAGDSSADLQTTRRLLEIRHLLDQVGSIMKPDFVARWIREPNEGFDGFSPLEVIERGQVDRIWRMVFSIAHGDAL